MALYNFKCELCGDVREIKMTFEQHSRLKNSLLCPVCGGAVVQQVEKLPFQLKGSGWFSSGSSVTENVGTGYETSQLELNKNLEMEKRIEDVAHEMQEKDNQSNREF